MQQAISNVRSAGSAWATRAAAYLRLWVEAERGHFTLFLPVCMAAGDLAYFALRQEPAIWTGLTCLLAGGAMAILLRANIVGRATGLVIATTALGFAAAQFATLRAPAALVLPRTAVMVSGTVQMVEMLPVGQRITLAAPRLGESQNPLPRMLRIKLRPNDTTTLQTGDSVRVRAIVSPPAPPAYPGAWDLQRDAWFSGLGGYGYALNPVEVIASQTGLAHAIELFREHLAARITTVLPGSDGAIAATLLTGMTAAIPAADREAFRDSGLSHLLAIAGLHIGIVMGLVMGGVRLLLALSERAALRLPLKQIAAAAALLAGAGYMIITGAHVPIIRSFAMASLVTLGLLAGRRAISLRGLMLAAAILLLIAPEQLVGVSMQMSFSAVLALIAGYAALRPWLQHLRSAAARYAVGLALTSLLAGAASAPFAAYHFGHVQIYFVIANMLAVPITALWVMPAGLLSLALMPFGLDRPSLLLMGAGVHAVLWVGREVSSWPAATLAVPHAPDWGMGVLALGMAWLGLWRSRLRLAGLPLLLLGLFSPLLTHPPDLLVSSDAKLIAIRTSTGAFAQSKSASDFTRSSWAQYWGVNTLLPLEQTCTPQACLLRARPDGPTALLVRDPTRRIPCGDAQLLVSAEPIRTGCGRLLPTIDRFTVWREGAQAVWLTPSGAKVLSDRADRGTRPWVAITPVRQTTTTLPMAPNFKADQ